MFFYIVLLIVTFTLGFALSLSLTESCRFCNKNTHTFTICDRCFNSDPDLILAWFLKEKRYLQDHIAILQTSSAIESPTEKHLSNLNEKIYEITKRIYDIKLLFRNISSESEEFPQRYADCIRDLEALCESLTEKMEKWKVVIDREHKVDRVLENEDLLI